MMEAIHGAMTTEQAHASGSIMMRMHKAYVDATMYDRAFAFQARTLLTPSEIERKTQMFQDRLQGLLKPEQAGRAAGVGGRLDQHCFQETLPGQNAEEVLLHEGGCEER